MKLLVSCIPYDRGKSGISVYVREVVRALSEQGHELTLLCEPQARKEESEKFKVESEKLESTATAILHSPLYTLHSPVLSMLWHLFVLPLWIRRHRREFDGFVICAANRRVCAWYPLMTVATVHDLANFHIPGKYSRTRMFYLAHVLPFFAKRAQHLVAVSEATKIDMVKFWHCREEDVTVLYNGLSKESSKFKVESENFKLSTILFISRIEHPGKNHVRLIEAYGKLPREMAEAHPLVIAGADWKDAEVVHEAARKSPHADLIRFTGFVDAADLPRLWSEAGFYVFPSLFEGFGLSLVEAMDRGIPCACSNNGSLGEIAGDVAITFDPYDVDSIAEALKNLLGESREARVARVARGREWIKRFSWEDHARGIAKLLGQKGVSRLFGIPVARVTETEAVERIISFAKRGKLEHMVKLESEVGVEEGNKSTLQLQLETPTRTPARKPAFIATLNVDFVANAVSGWPFGGNDELWGYLRNADLVTADGMPIVLLSKLLGMALPERVTGADMVPQICRRCAEEGMSVYVLGGDREAIEEALRKLKVESLKLKVVGIDPAFVKLDEEQPDIVARINVAKPDILFVALGNPKQELWMGRNAAKLDVGVMIGVGGTFNFIAGRVKRAPRWMQRCGLEWIYRIIQEPGRLWKRYAYGLVKFSWLSLRAMAGGYAK
ncbi:MAG: WecB/TagA/CpsF family glycosyltransferase [Kiritimatiellae bacterium]|nr:WecB/TagA/CpsF family glycosyltransferase [Kiritimatiellia bacterium]